MKKSLLCLLMASTLLIPAAFATDDVVDETADVVTEETVVEETVVEVTEEVVEEVVIEEVTEEVIVEVTEEVVEEIVEEVVEEVVVEEVLSDEPMTRGDMIEILYLLNDSEAVDYVSSFADIPADASYADAVAWGEAAELIFGNGDATYRGEELITRMDALTILYRYAVIAEVDGVTAGENTNILSYEDVAEVPAYAIPAMQWACAVGMYDATATTLDPDAVVSFADMGIMLEYIMVAEEVVEEEVIVEEVIIEEEIIEEVVEEEVIIEEEVIEEVIIEEVVEEIVEEIIEE